MAITKTKAATDCHIKLVMGDSVYIEEHNKIINDLDKKTELVELLKKFGLELEDFEGEPNNGLTIYLNPDTMFSAGRLEHNSINREFIATFNESIRKEEFMELWMLIQKNKIKKGISKTKHKPPQEDVLLYAIFKAVSKKKRLKRYTMTIAGVFCGLMLINLLTNSIAKMSLRSIIVSSINQNFKHHH